MARGSEMLSHNQTAVLLLAMNSAPLGLAVYSANHGGRMGHGVSTRPSPDANAAPIVKLEALIVHLKPDDDFEQGEHYGTVEFDLELAREEDRAAIVHRTGQIREAVLGYFLDRSLAQIK